MDTVLQARLPFAPWTDPRVWRLPGTQPADPDDWVRIDEAYAGQMRLRDGLIAGRRDDVLALCPEARAPARELLEVCIARARTLADFQVTSGVIRRPDGQRLPADREDPLVTVGRIFQEDFCILQKPPGGKEHVLTGAVLCFPAGWSLAEKIGRPLMRIHAPVPGYGDVGPRVQRMFDGLKPGRPVWRANAHLYDEPSLFFPRREADPRAPKVEGRFIRSEHQVLFRLPDTKAVVFSIHTYVVARSSLPDGAEAALALRQLTSGQ